MEGSRVPVRAIFIASDATGETAEKVVRAALLQFEQFDPSLEPAERVDAPSEDFALDPSRGQPSSLPLSRIELRVFPNLRHEHDLDTVVAEARSAQALLVSTLVRTEERELLYKKCQASGVKCVDLLGALLGSLAGFFGAEPRGVPGLLHAVSGGYFRRIEAIEFTVHADDGRDLESLPRADVVLVGISRTSKTPLSIYLAQKGYKVANVPLVLDMAPPAELFEVMPQRVFALTIQPEALLTIRRQRLARMHLDLVPDISYGQRDHILREIHYARSIYAAHPDWTVVDITGKAIEETAVDILRSLSLRSLG